MTTDDRIERFLDGWLTAGPTDLPPHVLDAAMHEIGTLPQVSQGPAWALPRLSPTSRLLLAAGLVLAFTVTVGVLGRLVALPTGPAQPAPAIAPSAPPASRALPEPIGPITMFESAAFGWSVEHPADWTVLDPMGDLVFFMGPADLWVHVYASPAEDAIGSGGLWWPWGSAWPIAGATTDELASAAVERLRADELDVLAVRPTTLGGEPAWRIDVQQVEFDERWTPARIYLLRHGAFAYGVFVYGVLADIPQMDAFLASFRFVDRAGTSPP